VAGEITYRFKDRLFFAQAAYNPKFAELSPGIVFAGLVIKDFSGKNYTIGDNLCGYADYLNPWARESRKQPGSTSSESPLSQPH
jgi:CelD/BcsL family acetyltransferase involved in cellulose biosynthesis